jgi:hypothetical protein
VGTFTLGTYVHRLSAIEVKIDRAVFIDYFFMTNKKEGHCPDSVLPSFISDFDDMSEIQGRRGAG